MNLSDIRNFMFGTLRGRLILGVAIIHAVMMTLFIIDITMRQSKILLNRQVEEATALAQSLSTSAAIWIASDDVSGLQELVESQRLYPELMFAMFTDEHGFILAHTEPDKCGLYLLDLPSLSNEPVAIKTTEIIQVLAPAQLDNRQIGWVSVGISRLATAEKLAKIKVGGIFYALMAIAIGSLIAWWMGIWFTKRLYAVQNTITEFRNGNHRVRSKMEGTDEAASIATEFNVLLDTLSSQHELLSALINSSTEMIIFSLDNNYCYTAFNKMHQKEMKKVWNVEIEVGMNLLECMHIPLLKEQAKHSMDRVLKGESFIEVQHQPGPDVYYELSWNPIFQKEEVIGITAFIRDITDQKHAEQKLKLLNFALNSVTDEAFLIDESACFQYVNDKSCRALGYSEEELLKMNVSEIDPDFPFERWLQHWNIIMETGFMIFETHHKTKQGSSYPVEISANYFEYNGQGFNLALARDISDRKQAEKALQESEEKYRTLIHKIQAAVIVHGPDTKIITCNAKALELMGLTEDQVLGKTSLDPVWHFLREDNTMLPLEEYPVNLVLATHHALKNYIIGVHHPDNENDVWVLVNADSVFGENDEITQVIVTFIDISERKQVSASLAKTTDLLNEAQQLAHIGSWELDIINNSLHWSDEIYRLFEIDPEKFDATYEAFLNAIHPDDRELVNYTYTNSLKNKMPYTIDHRLLLSDGRIKIVHEQCESFYDADGKPIRSIGIVQDITDRKQAEEELAKHRDHLEALVEERTKQLQESEFNYRRLFETMFQGVVYQDAEGKVISMNPAAEFILGKAQSELIGKPSIDNETQIFKEDGSLFSGEEHPAMLALNTGHEVQNAVMKLYNPRVKEYRWINISAMPLFHQNETKPYQVYTLFNDITESKAAEEALRVSEERMRLFFERQLVGMAITSLEKGWIKVNDKLCEMLGYSAEELMRLTWSEMTYPEDLAPDVEQFERLLHGEIDGYTLEKRFVRKDGSIVFTNLLVGCVRRSDRSVDYVLAILEDITGRKQADEQIRQLNEQLAARAKSLRQANKELEAFSYSVSHDLRAPLRSIDGFSLALIEDYHDRIDDQGLNYLQRVRTATQRMAQLIDDMLSLSRINRSEMNIQEVQLSKIVQEIADELHENQTERKVEFIVQQGIKVHGDEHLLRIVLVNLLGNAWKFTSKHLNARIEFGMLQQDGMPVYFVRDDGAGFDMNYAQKLFGAFQRLHTVNEFPGTGIGLAIVQRIIHRHKGKVWGEGEVENLIAGKAGGATFYFTIS